MNLYSHNGANNHGCEAIVRSCVKMLGKDMTLYTTNIEMDKKYALDKIINLKKVDKRISLIDKVVGKILRLTGVCKYYTYKKANTQIINADGDVFISIGGDNYCYNGYEKNLIAINNGLNNSGKKTILYGCSIEPDYIRNEKNIDDLRKYKSICARESITYNALLDAGLSNAKLMPDPAFVLDIQSVTLPKIFDDAVVGLNISELYINDFAMGKEKSYESMFLVIDYILENTSYNIALIPHVVNGSVDNEYSVNEMIYKKYEKTNRIAIIDREKNLNCMQIKYAISKCTMLIAARTHASIAGYSTCVPTLVLGYSVKSKGIARDIFGSEENYVLSVQDITSNNQFLDAFKWLNDNHCQIKETLEKVMPSYIAGAYEICNVLKTLC